MSKIRVLIKRVGHPLEDVEIESDLQTHQEVVGGFIEFISLHAGIGITVNEEGKTADLPVNFTYPGCLPLLGDVFFTKAHDGENVSLTDLDVQWVKNWLEKAEMAQVPDGEWEHVGDISVDAGLCWIGDPCYVLHKEKKPKSIGNSWPEFCDILQEKEKKDVAEFEHDLAPGLGVTVTSGWGDGFYPVFVKRHNGRIASVMVDFLTEEEEEDAE